MRMNVEVSYELHGGDYSIIPSAEK
jgi:hypothetical protein